MEHVGYYVSMVSLKADIEQNLLFTVVLAFYSLHFREKCSKM